MMEPWQVFFDIYREARRKKDHPHALLVAIEATVAHLVDHGERETGAPVARFGIATDRWVQAGQGDWMELRERLRHEWTDWKLPPPSIGC